MVNDSNVEEVVTALEGLVGYLREKNLEENDRLLARLAQSREYFTGVRERAEQAGVPISEEDFTQIMNELDVAEAELLRIRSEL